jgi:hypothetical protein
VLYLALDGVGRGPARASNALCPRNQPVNRYVLRRSAKVTGLAQKPGQLEAADREFQSKYWASLQLLGQPCHFHARPSSGSNPTAPVLAEGESAIKRCYPSERAQYQLWSYVSLSTSSGDGRLMADPPWADQGGQHHNPYLSLLMADPPGASRAPSRLGDRGVRLSLVHPLLRTKPDRHTAQVVFDVSSRPDLYAAGGDGPPSPSHPDPKKTVFRVPNSQGKFSIEPRGIII